MSTSPDLLRPALARLTASPVAVAAGVSLTCALLAGAGLLTAGVAGLVVAACAVGTAAGYSTSGSV
ncbi:hypothetical protein KZ829_36255 [Actinoplanes hulinensis]|uniref:Uncharacterized protein n=1 Tax=Actinoplanes hulinensis TaxID=1144547 RepID=A0ABS7BE92_9ACTN|nr:hypothetical protein [Actinoplanes hulinensis]MBW6439193.1 hypothetical protein [Actinoplanes hulinensis]